MMGATGRPRFSRVRQQVVIERVVQVRKAAGARIDALDLNIWLLDAGVSDAARDFRRAAITIAKRSANAIAGMPYLLYGTRSSIKALLRDRRERFGLNYISVPGQAMDEFAPIVQELRGT